MGIKQALIDCIPPAYYEDGTEAKCMIFRICNMFDVDPQSYKIVKETKDMDKKEKGNETKASFGKINHFVSDESEELSGPEWGPEIRTNGKPV